MSNIVKFKLSSYERLALSFVWAYAATVFVGARKIDIKVAEAKLEGMAKAAHALGYGNTETHVAMVVHEVMRDRPQPAWQATGVNVARDQWEEEAMDALAAALYEIF